MNVIKSNYKLKASTMNIKHIKLITFDLTDTLLAFRIPPGQYYAEIGEKHGIKCDPKVLIQNFKTHFKYMSKEHPNFGLKSSLGWENWWKEVISKTFSNSNSKIDSERLEALSSNLIKDYQTATCWKHCPGALDLLSYLKHKGLILGIVSNFDPRLDHTLRNVKIRHYFKFILSSYEFGISKPDPKIFAEAMRLSEIKNLKDEECLHVGDSLALDYEGAKGAGWNAVLIKESSEVEAKDNTFSSLYEFHKYFLVGTGEKLLVNNSS